MKNRIACVPCALLAFSVGCANEELTREEEIARAVSALYPSTIQVWKQSNISVCWDTAGYAVEKQWIQSAVASTWQRYTALAFTGWQACTSAGANIRITLEDVTDLPHTAGLGVSLNNFKRGMVLNPTLVNYSTESCESINDVVGSKKFRRHECVRMVAIHEFGHALGFAHEQNRTDTPSDCKPCTTNAECDSGQTCRIDGTFGHCIQGSNGSTTIGRWDVRSVMNYCNPLSTNHGYLSEVDKLGAQRYYGRPNYFANVDGVNATADAIVVNSDGVYVKPAKSSSTFGSTTNWTGGGYFGNLGTFFADVTGDGKDDAIVVSDNLGVVVRRSTGSSFSANEDWTAGVSYFGTWGNFFADVTGDGRADAIVINADKVVVRRSTGSKFTANEKWFGTIPNCRDILFGDVDGDRKVDLVLVTDDNVTVAKSTGSAFGAFVAFTTNQYAGQRGQFLTDVTGDGLADMIVVNDDWVVVRRSTGFAFSGNEYWSSAPPLDTRGGVYFSSVQLREYAGPRPSDLIFVNDSSIQVGASLGSSFATPLTTWSGSFHGLL